GRRVVQSLVTFAQRGSVVTEWHNPADLVKRVLDLKYEAFRTAGIDLKVEYAPELPMFWADGPQFQQVLLNLLSNAEQALAGWPDPRIVVHIYTSRTPVERPAVLPALAHAVGAADGESMIVFDIADNGPGLPPLILARLFEPFVTTR